MPNLPRVRVSGLKWVGKTTLIERMSDDSAGHKNVPGIKMCHPPGELKCGRELGFPGSECGVRQWELSVFE
jgi:hypothetical protein